MSSLIHLLICVLVFLPSYCSGSEEFFIKGKIHNFRFSYNFFYTNRSKIQWLNGFCIDGLKIEERNWYRNVRINELEGHIKSASNLGFLEKFLSYASVEPRSPAHGQLIDSQLSEEGYSVYWNAEIISAASDYIYHSHCPL